jgi:uncharacterized membrane protein
MNRDWYKTLTWLMWAMLAVSALNYWMVWDRLPARMAVHFDANFQPNGYTSKEGAVELGLGIMAVARRGRTRPSSFTGSAARAWSRAAAR